MTEFDWEAVEAARARHQEPEPAVQPGDEFDAQLEAEPCERAPEDCQCGRCGPTGLLWGSTVHGKRHHP